MLRKLVPLALSLVLLPAALLLPQTRKTDLKTAVGRFPLQVTAEYLGMAGKKTVVRIRLSSPELSKAAASAGVRAFAGELRGTFSRGAEMVEAFRYSVAARSPTRFSARCPPATTA